MKLAIVGGLGVVAAGAALLMRPGGNDGAQAIAKRLIIKKEGFRAQVYKDSAGLPTIGYGHLLKPGETFPQGITELQAAALLEKDMRTAVRAVESAVKVPLSNNEKAALISFAYNVGAGAFAASTLVKKLNRDDRAGAAAQFEAWVYAGGKRVQGLANRRAEEKALFLS